MRRLATVAANSTRNIQMKGTEIEGRKEDEGGQMLTQGSTPKLEFSLKPRIRTSPS